jgi:hypothetical protein
MATRWLRRRTPYPCSTYQGRQVQPPLHLLVSEGLLVAKILSITLLLHLSVDNDLTEEGAFKDEDEDEDLPINANHLIQGRPGESSGIRPTN